MTSNIGNPDVTPSPPIHNVPAADSPSGSLSPKLIIAEGQFLLDSFIGAVAIALGNVSILGVKPLAFLTTWGEQLEAKASQALTNAQTAQTTATTAQTTSNNIIDEITGILTGATGDSGDTSALNLAIAPLRFIGNIAESFDVFATQVLGRLGSLEAGASAAATTAMGGGLVAGRDPCNTATNFTPVSPTATFQSTGWGAIESPTLAVAHYNATLSTDRPRVGFTVKAKTPGYNWIHICSSTTMDLFVALLLTSTSNGQDTIALVLGTEPDPSTVTPLATYQTRIANESFLEAAYDPYVDGVANSNTFYVWLNNSQIVPLQFQDNGNLAMHDSSHRDIGAMAFGGFAITEFTYKDWTDDAPQ